MAIAYDTSANTTSSFNGNTTFSHTCTGSDLILIVSVILSNNARSVSSMTYNSVAMTQAATFTGNGKVDVWYLINPATGAHTVAVNTNTTGAEFCTAESISLTGVDQTSPIGATGTGTSPSAAAISASVTTTRINSFIVDSAYSSSASTASLTANGVNQTRRNNILFNSSTLDSAQSTIPATTVGSYTVSYTTHGAASNDILAVEIKQKNVVINVSDTITTVEAADVRGKRFYTFSDSIGTSDAVRTKIPPKNTSKSSTSWTNVSKT